MFAVLTCLYMRSILNPAIPESDYINRAEDFSDSELFAHIADGEQGALVELYNRYSGQVFRFLRHQLHDEQGAEEVLQDVFLAAWDRAKAFKGRSSVKTWLLRVAYYRSATWLSRRKQADSLDVIENVPSELPGPEKVADDRLESEQVLSAFHQLSQKHRTAIDLVFYQELTYKEAAQVAGCPVGTMKSRVSHALEQINRLMLRGNPDRT